MKKSLFGLLFFVFALLMFSACEKEEDGTAPELPPYESMSIDFSKFSDDAKSTASILTDTSSLNFAAASLTAGYWSLAIGLTLAVPIATFYESFNHEAVFIGNSTWQWTYDVEAVGGTYVARMTGQIASDEILWEMYVSKEGVGAFAEFKWFEGSSSLDGESGQWTYYLSYEVQEEVLQIDWVKTNEEIGEIKYTYVRESDSGVEKQLSQGSYVQYGLTDDVYDAYYNIHYTTRDIEEDGFLDVNINWSTSDYYGRIKAEHYFQDTDWHCWDNEGYDSVCE